MLCDLNSLKAPQLAFLERWQMAGGPQAELDDLSEIDRDCLLCCAEVGGEWVYYRVGEEHFELTGTKLEGTQRNVLGNSIAELAYIRNSTVCMTGEPHRYRAPGIIGESMNLWGERLSVPIKPPVWGDRAVLSHYSWHRTVSYLPLVKARQALIEEIGPELEELFADPDMRSLHRQLKLVRSLAEITPEPRGRIIMNLADRYEDVIFQDERLRVRLGEPPASAPEPRNAASAVNGLRLVWPPVSVSNDNPEVPKRA